jgi:hypothetical protein
VLGLFELFVALHQVLARQLFKLFFKVDHAVSYCEVISFAHILKVNKGLMRVDLKAVFAFAVRCYSFISADWIIQFSLFAH